MPPDTKLLVIVIGRKSKIRIELEEGVDSKSMYYRNKSKE